MKKHSEVVVYDPATDGDKIYELHTEKPKNRPAPYWYIKDPEEEGKILNKEEPFESRPTIEQIFKVVGGK